MSAEIVIATEQLTRRFGATTAVDQLDLNVERGEIFGLLGHNGAGKTTTVRLLNGVLTPSAGKSNVLGFDPASQGAELRHKTGVLTETPSLDDRLSARDTLTIFADIFGVAKEKVKTRVDGLLDQFGLLERATERVGGYSKGMRQRLAIARTLLHEPELIFLDEPTAGLDPVATRELHNLIIHLSRDQQRTVILCTHNLVEAQKLCHRVAVMAQGKLLACGTTAELRGRYSRSQRLQIEIDPTQKSQAVATIQALPGVKEVVALNGDNGDATLSVQGVGYDETPSFVQTLVAHGIALYRVLPEEASLEDVYFALQEK
ncbi:MAG: ABC transporter ATP-binding protein [Caldilineaceae bacterium]